MIVTLSGPARATLDDRGRRAAVVRDLEAVVARVRDLHRVEYERRLRDEELRGDDVALPRDRRGTQRLPLSPVEDDARVGLREVLAEVTAAPGP